MLFKHFNYTDKQHGVETVDFRSNYIETRNIVFFIPYNEMYYKNLCFNLTLFYFEKPCLLQLIIVKYILMNKYNVCLIYNWVIFI